VHPRAAHTRGSRSQEHGRTGDEPATGTTGSPAEPPAAVGVVVIGRRMCTRSGWALVPVMPGPEAPGAASARGAPAVPPPLPLLPLASANIAATAKGSAASHTLYADRMRGRESTAITAICASWLRRRETVPSNDRTCARREATSSFLAASWDRSNGTCSRHQAAAAQSVQYEQRGK
jgi:hypothetical protein